MGKYKKIGKNTSLIFVGGVVSKLISMLMLPLYTRWLSIEEYGVTDLIIVYSSLLMGIASFCISDAMFVFPKNANYNDRKKYFSSGLLFIAASFSILGVIFFILYVLNKHLWNFENAFFLNIDSIYYILIASCIQTFIQQFVCSIDKMRIYSTTGIVLTLSTALLSYVFMPTYKIQGFIWATIASHMIAAFYAFVFSHAYKYVSRKAIEWIPLKQMLYYSIPLVPNTIMWWLVGSINRPIMEGCLGLTAIGLFAVSQKIPTILNTIYGSFNTSWQISVIEEYNKSDFNYFFNKMLILSISFISIIMISLSCVSKYIIMILADIKFLEAYVYVPVLLLSIVFVGIGGVSGSIFSAVKEGKYYFYSSFLSALASVLSNVLFIPVWGIWGAAASITISHMVMGGTRLYFAKKYVVISCYKTLLLIVLIDVLAICLISIIYSDIINLVIGLFSISYITFVNWDKMITVYNKIKSAKNE